jgi:hypothetical protein
MIRTSSLTSADVIHIAELMNRISARSQKLEDAALQDVFASDNGKPRADYNPNVSKVMK